LFLIVMFLSPQSRRALRATPVRNMIESRSFEKFQSRYP
jgi:hypothetical protein